MSLRKAFTTDLNLERNGIEIDYGSAIITVRRAGGTNRAYKAALSKALRPFRAQMETGDVQEVQLLPAMVGVLVEEVILNWQTRHTDGTLEVGIESAEGVDGPLIAFTKAAAIQALLDMPELFYNLQDKATSPKLFLADLESAAKN